MKLKVANQPRFTKIFLCFEDNERKKKRKILLNLHIAMADILIGMTWKSVRGKQWYLFKHGKQHFNCYDLMCVISWKQIANNTS